MSKKGSARERGRQDKRAQFASPKKSNLPILFVAAVAFVFLGITIFVTVKPSSSAPEAVAGPSDAQLLPAGADARLPVSTFSDGRAHFYRYVTSVGREVRLFVIRSSDGVIRAAFDACDVCYRSRKGYHQEGDDMVCNNCGRHFRSVDVNVITGGCNPSALQRTFDGSQVVLKTSDLDLGAAYF